MNYSKFAICFLVSITRLSVVTWIPSSIFNTQYELCAMSNGIGIGTLLKSLARS
jgi:hypothetical protein